MTDIVDPFDAHPSGIVDPFAPGYKGPAKDAPQIDTSAPLGSEGFVGGLADAGRGLAHGVISDLPQQVGQAAQFFGAKNIGDKMVEFAKEQDEAHPELKQSVIGQVAQDNPLSVRGGAFGAGSNTPLSTAPGVAGAAIGAGIGAAFGGVGAIPGAALGYAAGSLAALPIFYGSQAQQSKEKVYKANIESGMTPEQAEANSNKAGHISGSIEAGGELLADAIPFHQLLSPFAKPIKGAMVRSMLGGGLKRAAKVLGEQELAEVSTEMAQQAGETETEHQFGAGEGASWKDTASVLMPTALMTLLPGGLTAAHSFHSTAKIKEALTDADADPERRMAAAATVFHGLKEKDPAVALAFDQYAADQIEAGKPVAIADDRLYLEHWQEAQAAAQTPQTAPSSPISPQTTPSEPTPEDLAQQDPFLRRTPSQEAGIDPAAGPISAAATTALDTGVTHAQGKSIPFANEEAAQARADAQTNATGEAHVVVPHPEVPGRFSVLPQAHIDAVAAKDEEAGNAVEAASKVAQKVLGDATSAGDKALTAEESAAQTAGKTALEAKDEPAKVLKPGEKPAPKPTAEETKVHTDALDRSITKAEGNLETLKATGDEGRAAAVERLVATLKAKRDALTTEATKAPTPTTETTNAKPETATPAPKETPPTVGPVKDVGADKADGAGPEKAPETALTDAAHEAATSPKNDKPAPTPEQIAAGNYAKGHLKVSGLDLAVENPEGSVRKSQPGVTPAWERTIAKAHYGYIKGTIGKDKDHVDAFVKPGTKEDHAGPVFVIDQVNAKGGFDEHKVLLGYKSKMEALVAYKANYPADFKVGQVHETTTDRFKGWLKNSDTTKPYNEMRKPTAEDLARTAEHDARRASEDAAIAAAPKDAQGRSTNPAGVYEPTESIELANPRKGWKGGPDASISLVKLDTGEWTYGSSHNFHHGDMSGHGFAPSYVSQRFATRDEAVAHAAAAKLKEFQSFKTGNADVAAAQTAADRYIAWAQALLAPKRDVKKELADAKAKKEAEAAAKKNALVEARAKAKTHELAVRKAQLDLFNLIKARADFDTLHASENPRASIEAFATPEGRAEVVTDKLVAALVAASKSAAAKRAAEAKKARLPPPKLTNTGVDLRRHWELEKQKIKARDEAEGIGSMNRIFAATTRADFFDALLAKDATPAAQQYADMVRDRIKTFKDWVLGEAGPLNGLSRRWRSDSDVQKITDFVKGTNTLRNKEMWRGIIDDDILDKDDFVSGGPAQYVTLEHRIKLLTNAADQYIDHVSKLIEPMRNKAEITSTMVAFITPLVEAPVVPDARVKFTPYAQEVFKAGIIEQWEVRNRLMGDSQAVKHLIANEATITAKAQKDRLLPPRLERVVREMPNVIREGNITPAKFKATFGFSDVGFGSWVNSKEDQAHLNSAFDAFMDMANFIGMDPKQIGFGGKLHFTLGALGQGSKAAATFHPAHPGPNGIVQVINLTKTKGDGTVSHEWLHALDHFLQYTDDGKMVMNQLLQAVSTKNRELAGLRTQLIGGLSRTWGVKQAEDWLDYHARRPDQTEYKREANKLDPDYWGNPQEMRARAWEAHIGDNLGGSNNYLVNTAWVGDGMAMPPKYRGIPYPRGLERKEFSKWYTALTSSLVVKDGTLAVDLAKWNANKPTTQEDYLTALADLKAEIPELWAQKQREIAAAKALKDREAAEQKAIRDEADAQAARDRQAAFDAHTKDLEARAAAAAEAKRLADEAQAREDLANNPPGETVPATGALNDDDLEKMFDAAAESVTAEAAENIHAPEPGQPAHEGSTEQAPPKFEPPKNEDGPEIRVSVVRSGAGKGLYDATVYSGPLRGASALGQTEALAREKLAVIMAERGAPKAKALIAEAAKQGVKGIDEALTGLTKLFGGGPGKLQSFPGGMDEKTYQEAKPHFAAALKAFQAAGKSLMDLFKMLIQQFGEGVKPYAIRFAKEEKLTATLGENVSASSKVADWVLAKLIARESFSGIELFGQANTAFGGTQAEKAYTPKDAYDALEAGMNRWILQTAPNMLTLERGVDRAKSTMVTLGLYTNLVATQTKRTQEQDEFQQFSTVPALAYAMNWVANVKKGESYLEPSAGIGGLAVFGKLAGANVVVNEFSSRRAAVLREVLPDAQVFTEDASQLNNVLPDAVKPTVIVMNPPFSATAGRVEGQRDSMNGAKHLEQALERLEAGGRLVALVGNAMAETEPRFMPWWDKIKAEYNVRANLSLSGTEYAKYGTQFDNNLLVIDKTGPTKNDVVTGRVEAYSELPAILESIRNDRVEPRTNIDPESGTKQPDSGEAIAPGVDTPGVTPPVGVGGVGTGTGHQGGNVNGPATGGRPGGGNGKLGPGQRPGVHTGDRPGRPGAKVGPADDGKGSGDRGAGLDQGPAAGELALDTAGIDKRNEALTDNIFEPYRPLKAKIEGSKPHPGKLVESAAMAAVDPPDVTYTPNLPKKSVTGGLVSDAQLEAIIYAGQAHAQMLPDGSRRGFFIGDGTGVGKGREVSGILIDNTRQGRDKHVWISAKSGLFRDAQRDYGGTLGRGLTDTDSPSARQEKVPELFQLGDYKPVDQKKGVMFTTYATLRSEAGIPGLQGLTATEGSNDDWVVKDKAGKVLARYNVDGAGKPFKTAKAALDYHEIQHRAELAAKGIKVKTRLDQIVDWLGPDFEGVLAFDEAHAMANMGTSDKEAAQQALVGAELRKRLPQARVVLVSATGATEASNLMYAERLGLWGKNTAFADVHTFINQITAAGLATMELVARELKGMGAYIARSLSYEGVTQERLDIQLTPLQTEMYDELAVAWQGVISDIHKALEITGGDKNPRAKRFATSQLWSANQRFFNQILTSLMTPQIIERAQAEIEKGNAPVFQFVNTNEATQERVLQAAEAAGTELEELDFTPRDVLKQLVDKTFPTQAHAQQRDPRTGKVTSVPLFDAQGKPIHDKKALAMKAALLQKIDDIKMPGNPIDLILEGLGYENVAEVTGRGRRVVREVGKDGAFKLVEQKRGPSANKNDAQAFMDDKKKALIFSGVGGTGYSFQSDLDSKNQRQRVHFLVQAGWQASAAIQGMGRTHRTNEANQPHYILPTTNLKAQMRFISSIARRLDQLGALTKGQRNTSSQGLFTNRDNLESTYAQAAVRQLFMDMTTGPTPGTTRPVDAAAPMDLHTEGMRLITAMGLAAIVDPMTRRIKEGEMPDVVKFLNRILNLKVADQNFLFEEFGQRLDAATEAAIAAGTYDDGMQTVKALKIQKLRDETIYTDARTGQTTHYIELELTDKTPLNTWEDAQHGIETHPSKNGFAYYVDNQTGQPFVAIDMGSRVGADGRPQSRAYRYNVKAASLANRGHYISNLDTIARGGEQRSVVRNDEGKLVGAGPGVHDDVKHSHPRFEKISPSQAEYLWAQAHDTIHPTETRSLHMLTGALLPVWDRINATNTASVVRTQTDDGERFIGRVLNDKDRPGILKNFGVGALKADTTTAEIIGRIMGGETAQLSNGWLIKKVKVASDTRMEVIATYMSSAEQRNLKDAGAFVERIGYKERVFLPTGKVQEAVFEAVTREANRPVVEFLGGEEEKLSLGIQGTGQLRAAVLGTVTKLAAKWQNAPAIMVVQQVSDLPFAAPAITRGAVSGGKVYLVADNLPDAATVQHVLLHEVTGHYGLKGVLGNRLDPMMARIYDSNPAVKAAADARMAHYQRNGRMLTKAGAAEEALADMSADELAQLSGWKMLVAAIRSGLRSLGFDLAMSDNDVAALLGQARRFVEDPANVQPNTANPQLAPALALRPRYTANPTNIGGKFWVEDERGHFMGDNHDTLAQAEAMARALNNAPTAGPHFSAVTHLGKYRVRDNSGAGPIVALGLVGDAYDSMEQAVAAAKEMNDRQPLFSLADPGGILGQARQVVMDSLTSARQFNPVLKNFQTQYHKAQTNEFFRPVFQSVQRYMQDVSQFAMGAADLAPSLLPRLQKLGDVFKGGAKHPDVMATGRVLFAATLGDVRPTDAMLRAGFTVIPAYGGEHHVSGPAYASEQESTREPIDVPALTEPQIALYHEARDAIDLSLDQVAASEMTRLVKGHNIEDAVRKAHADPGLALSVMSSALQEQAGVARAAGMPGVAKKIEALLPQLQEIADRANQLKDQGYAPLMRFGQYTVDVFKVTDGAHQRLYFGMFESRREANEMARRMRAQYEAEGGTVTLGTMDHESWKLLQGLSLDSLATFAKETGLDHLEVFQDYFRLAVSSRSALKRLIHREGIAGYNEDLQRVLAGFVTSQARLASRNYHYGEMLDAHMAIPTHMGDVKTESSKLIQYVQNPVEEAPGIRAFLFVNFIGGSVASALTNATQPIMMTLPYLSQWGGPIAAARALKNSLAIGGGSLATDPGLRTAMDRAAHEGVTEPQELHQLYAQSIRTLGSNLWVRKGLRVWGSMFSLAESFNRRITFAAAYQLAQERGIEEINAKLAAAGQPTHLNAYDFAVNAVEDTQGIYNRGNRPNYARGPIGATIFTFKQFSIAYIEFLSRLPAREKALAGALLLMAAGMQGAPGADALEDLIDTIGQLMGYNTNSKKALREVAARILGESMGGFLTHGISGIPGVPLDVQGRLGVNNLIPGTALFKRSETDKGKVAAQFGGVMGGMETNLENALVAAEGKRWDQMVQAIMPSAIQNAMKGVDMWTSGQYKDIKGRKVIDTTTGDAALKLIGIQPADVAQASRRAQDVRQDVNMVKTVESSIADRWARGVLDHDTDAIKNAIQDLFAWNLKNEMKIAISPAQIQERVKEAQMERATRVLKAAPKEARGEVGRTLQ